MEEEEEEQDGKGESKEHLDTPHEFAINLNYVKNFKSKRKQRFRKNP